MAYLTRLSARPDDGVPLVCFPYAGAGASCYQEWASLLKGHACVYGVTLPGRGARLREPPVRTLEEAARAVTAEIAAGICRGATSRVALYGHSIGAILAFETARSLAGAGLSVEHLMVGGQGPPHLVAEGDPEGPASPQDVMDILAELHTASSDVSSRFSSALEDEEFRERALQVISSDFEMGASYRYRDRPPLRCPVTVFGGTDDPYTSATELDRWSVHTAGPVRVMTVSGGHFFLHDSAELTCTMIIDLLGNSRGGVPASGAG